MKGTQSRQMQTSVVQTALRKQKLAIQLHKIRVQAHLCLPGGQPAGLQGSSRSGRRRRGSGQARGRAQALLGDAEGRGAAARARRAPPPPPRQQRAARARVYVPRGAADVTAEWQHCGDAETQSLGVGSLVPAGSARSAGGRAAAGRSARASADARLSTSRSSRGLTQDSPAALGPALPQRAACKQIRPHVTM
ncbi:hypothetical protein LEMLEM_LOCUS7039 [Lemmus lemmus]